MVERVADNRAHRRCAERHERAVRILRAEDPARGAAAHRADVAFGADRNLAVTDDRAGLDLVGELDGVARVNVRRVIARAASQEQDGGRS